MVKRLRRCGDCEQKLGNSIFLVWKGEVEHHVAGERDKVLVDEDVSNDVGRDGQMEKTDRSAMPKGGWRGCSLCPLGEAF